MSSVIIAAPTHSPLPLVTPFASSSKTKRFSSSSTASHASSSSACPSFTPSRDSIHSTSSDGWSSSLVTPRGDRNFDFEVFNYVDDGDRVEHIDLADKENWWNAAASKQSIRSTKQGDKEQNINSKWLDDSPTLPASTVLPDIDKIPSIALNQPLSKKKLGKLPIQSTTSICDLEKEKTKSERSIFDIFGMDNGNTIDQDVFASVPIRRSFTKKRLPLPSFSTNPTAPAIPARASSKRPPILPFRASSLKSLSTQATSDNQTSGPSKPTHLHRPAPIHTFSYPPPSTSHRSSLKKHRRISPVLLQPISETPKDLDVPPEGSWALRRSPPKLGSSKSQPNLRSNSIDMTMKFKLKRSNSSNGNQYDGNDFMSRDSFPSSSSRNSLDVDKERDRDSRSSFSDMARSFMPLSVPESPSRISLDGRPTIQSGTTKKSPKSNNFLGGLKKSQSQKRPSLLGLPEWSPRPNPRSSISDSYIPQLPSSVSSSSSRTLEALRSGCDSPSSSSLKLELTEGKGGEAIFRRNSSRHSIASSISSKMNNYLEEDLLAVLESEHWDWPSPPFRIQKINSDSTPGLSTSGTLESIIIQNSPQTPSESEFVLHGESEWLAKAAKEKEKERFWRPLSLGESIESLDIIL